MGGTIAGVPWYVIPIVVVGLIVMAYSTLTSRSPRFSLTGKRRGPSGDLKSNPHLHQAVERLAEKNGGRLSVPQIADASGLSESQVVELMEAMTESYSLRVQEETNGSTTYEFPQILDKKP